MVILGIDPGYAIVGYGVLSYCNYRFRTLGYGAITTSPDTSFYDRLKIIYHDMNMIIEKYLPDELSIEKLFFNTNTTTAIDVAQARGVITLSATNHNLKINEYTPLQVKSSITGYGLAEKQQVMKMVQNILKLNSIPKPDDTADALALAVCHGYNCGNLLNNLR